MTSETEQGQKFVTVTYSNNQDIKHHRMYLHIDNNMLSLNRAYDFDALLLHVCDFL